jgi:hypothetical protein
LTRRSATLLLRVQILSLSIQLTVNGERYVDIPSDDDNINVYEHAANTVVDIRLSNGKPNELILVTTDSSDEYGPKDYYTCDLNSLNLASLM